MAAKRSAGILLYRHQNGRLELLLAHPGGPYWSRRDAGAWTIPKGEIEPGEETCACALRELREELGPAAKLEPDELIELGSVRQRSGKVVEAWAAEGEFDPAELVSSSFSIEWPPRSGVEREFPEVDRARWFAAPQARAKILPAQAPLIDRLVEHLVGPAS
jgi:predicted NUDIX family NTP pyrophosphohydrolase